MEQSFGSCHARAPSKSLGHTFTKLLMRLSHLTITIVKWNICKIYSSIPCNWPMLSGLGGGGEEEEEEEGFTLTFRSLAVKEIIAQSRKKHTVSEKLTPPH